MNKQRLTQLKDGLLKLNPSNLDINCHVRNGDICCLMGFLPDIFPNVFHFTSNDSINYIGMTYVGYSCDVTEEFFELNDSEFVHIFERSDYRKSEYTDVNAVVHHIDSVLNNKI